MFVKYIIILCAITATVLSSPKDIRLLFPHDKQYIYEITASLTSGTITPREAFSSWTLEGRLHVQVLGNDNQVRFQLDDLKRNLLNTSGNIASREAFSSWTLEGRLDVQVLGNDSQVRFQLDDLKTSVNSKNDGYISYQFEEEARDIKLPWIVDFYKEFCLVESIYLPEEPAWVSNIKRALTLNFQLKSGDGYYTSYELCVHDYSCFTTYLSNGSTIKKYSSLPYSPKFGSSWKSVPWTDPIYKHDQYLWNALPDTTTMTSERVYKLDDKSGLTSLKMRGNMTYRTEELTLFVNTELQIQYEEMLPPAKLEWPKLIRSAAKHSRDDCSDPSCGIRETNQEYLKNRTYDILLKISKKGIDADSVVKDPTMVHSLDFINLINTMSQLNYTTLRVLFEDLVLGTSYELETSRNIFLEVLPFAGTDATVRFVKYLVIEEEEKVEDSALLSLIRKLPFNSANYSQQLLQELEPFTKLGLDSPQEIRHAAILSFATMLYQAKRAERVGTDYFDNMIVKYLRMYSDCPHYMDRLVWLQGLCNIGYSTQKYTMEIYTDPGKKRNERLWAAFASNYIDNQYYTDEPLKAIELLLPVLTNETEDGQIRMAALHTFLTATSITQNDFLFVHNYVKNSDNGALKRFWFTAIKSLEENRNFDGYKLASVFLPSVSDSIFDLDPEHWATNNVIFSSEDQATSMHLLSMADDTGLPSFAAARLTTSGKRASVYIVAEGVASNMYKRMHAFDEAEMDVQKLVNILKDLKVWAVKNTEEVHVDFVFKLQEKAVFVAHMNQTRFDSWNLMELAKSVNEFLRLGSHINQQIVYYPSQMELIFPNELGIPVRLQTTSVSFTSIRGNLTTPATDIHIRYQGMSLTSLSTYGPMVQSEHAARIQKSMVAHLPIKFNISHAPVEGFKLKNQGMSLTSLSTYGPMVQSEHAARIQKSMVAHLPIKFNISHAPVEGFNFKTDFMLPIQNGGVVIHTRTQVEKSTKHGIDLYTVRSKENTPTHNRSIFSDCENSTFNMKLEHLFTRNIYSMVKYLQPSRLLLRAIPLILAPPTSSCGVIHLHNAAILDVNRGIKATFLVENLPSIVDFFSGDKNVFKSSLLLKDFRQDTEVSGEILNFEIDFEIRNQNKNIVSRLEFNSTDTVRTFIENNDYLYVGDENTALDSKYKNHITAGYYETNSTEVTKSLDIFVDTTKSSTGEKRIDIKFTRDVDTVFYPLMYLILPFCSNNGQTRGMKEMQLPQDIWVPLYLACVSESFKMPIGNPAVSNTEISAVLKDGVTSVAVTNSPDMRLKSPEIVWWMDNWITLKKMTTFGLYKECRFQGSTVQMLNGLVQTYHSKKQDTVALADCTGIPRFAVIRQKSGGVKVYAGGKSLSTRVENGEVAWTASSEEGHPFRITKLSDGMKVQSKGSGVQVYYRINETVILIPNSHLHAVCGECTGEII